MAEQTFKSPGFFEREIEVVSRPLVSNRETPVGIVGPAEKGPAFVPVTVSSDTEFFKIFGRPDRNRYPAHAISEFFREGGKSATFCRILGSGKGKDASFSGFKIEGSALVDVAGGDAGNDGSAKGAVQFLIANHVLDAAEHITLGIFNDNDSHTTAMDQDPSDDDLTDDPDPAAADGTIDRLVQLVRAMFFVHKDCTIQIEDSNASAFNSDLAKATAGDFLIRVCDITNGSNILDSTTVSLDPASSNYITKVLNTDPLNFTEAGYVLYADFPVDDVLATTQNQSVAIVRGDGANLNEYGKFDARYSAPQTPYFISQPFGTTEYDLFKIESLDDGSYASGKYKTSIVNLKASTEKNYKFGTFGLQLRDLDDTDDNPIVYESYNNLSLDPNSDNFIAKVIGDQKVYLDLDVDSEDEKRLVREGAYAPKSTRIRVVVADAVLNGEAPAESLPFGFRGVPALFTTSGGTDANNTSLLSGQAAVVDDAGDAVGHAVLPPLPYRLKVTKGNMTQSESWFQTYLGETTNNSESVKTYLYWGLFTTKITDIKDPNKATASDISPLVRNLTKFMGKSETVIKTGALADSFNNNKFSLAKIAFAESSLTNLPSSALDAFREAVYVRNADVGSDLYDAINQQIVMSKSIDPFSEEDATGDAKNLRISLAKLLSEDPVKFNRFSIMSKFTAPFYGGFDGVNILDEDDYYFTDRASSTVVAGSSVDGVPGHAADGGYVSGLATTNAAASADSLQGYGLDNNAVASYMNAIKLMTDEMVSNINVLVVPGIRDPLITDYAARRVKSYGKALYLMDMEHIDFDSNRIFVSPRGVANGRPDIDACATKFDTREVNNSYVATYFPDVSIEDSSDDDDAAVVSRRIIRIPSSIAALGSLARTDVAGTPWFAPAGFSRGSLSRVKSLDVRLSAGDRDTLYEARINPIANFPNNQFVIFGQKTTQIARTALDRVNVRRLMIRIKSDIQKIAQGILFEQNDAQTRGRFISQASAKLQKIRIAQGIEDFRVIMDETNNSDEDVDNNRLNGKIIVVPTRAIEYIAMDFVITNSGVEFPS